MTSGIAQSEKTRAIPSHHPFFFWSSAGLLVILLGVLLLPTLRLGLVADDFILLVPDQTLPLTQSPDQLHRPLRNVALRMMDSGWGIQHVLPYRLLMAASFLAALWFIFLLARRLGVGRAGALAAVFVLAFFPRNEEVLYWFAAWQDLVAAAAVLLACILFLNFRDSASLSSLGLASIAYGIALGFKETTVVLPALLLAIDLYREPSVSLFFQRRRWKAYIPFAGILLLYAAYFFSESGAASLAGKRTGGYYGFHGIVGVVTGLIRAALNVALPFMNSFGLKDIRPWYLALVLLEAGIVLFFVWRLRLKAALILMAAWVLLSILPTATFAAAFNADRYLFVPFLGVALFAGSLAGAMLGAPGSKWQPAVACVALALYTSLGMYQLVAKYSFWRNAGDEVATVIAQTTRLSSRFPAGSEVDFVNLTHSYRPTGMVFANGLSEALHAHGFPHTVRIVRNFSAPEPEQNNLVQELEHCGVALPGVSSQTVLMLMNGRLQDINSGCAAPFLDADRAQRPESWGQLYPAPLTSAH